MSPAGRTLAAMGRINAWHDLECPARTAPGRWRDCDCPPQRFLERGARPVRGPGISGWLAYWAALAREAIAARV